MSKIWFTSDLHFSHNKPFIYEPRGFSNIAEMNAAIINRFREVVAEDDDLYILGDLMLKDNEVGIACINALPGRKFIILGNHDTDSRANLYIEKVRDLMMVQYATILHYEGYHFYLSHYPSITSNNDYEKPLKARTLNLCGHSHVQDRWSDWDKGYIYHVEVDCHNCYPVCIDTVIEEIKAKVKGDAY